MFNFVLFDRTIQRNKIERREEEYDDQMIEQKEIPTLFCGKKRIRNLKVITVQDRLEKVRKTLQTLALLELRCPQAPQARKKYQRLVSAYETRILNYDQELLSLA